MIGGGTAKAVSKELRETESPWKITEQLGRPTEFVPHQWKSRQTTVVIRQ
jgi:hypothetical protein